MPRQPLQGAEDHMVWIPLSDEEVRTLHDELAGAEERIRAAKAELVALQRTLAPVISQAKRRSRVIQRQIQERRRAEVVSGRLELDATAGTVHVVGLDGEELGSRPATPRDHQRVIAEV